MKLTKIQKELLHGLWFNFIQHGPPIACKIGYRPAQKIVDLGLAKIRNQGAIFFDLVITENGREFARRNI
jgi:hypothetical protein